MKRPVSIATKAGDTHQNAPFEHLDQLLHIGHADLSFEVTISILFKPLVAPPGLDKVPQAGEQTLDSATLISYEPCGMSQRGLPGGRPGGKASHGVGPLSDL